MRPEPAVYAGAWIAAWNAHDLDAVLAHYAADVVFTSANSSRYTGDASGRVVGRAALRDYWAQSLAGAPNLTFTLKAVYGSPDGVAIRYFNSRAGGEAVEVARFNADGLVCESAAYYE